MLEKSLRTRNPRGDGRSHGRTHRLGVTQRQRRWYGIAVTTAIMVLAGGVAVADPATNQSISINGAASTTDTLAVTVTAEVVHCPPGGDLQGMEVAFSNTSTAGPWTVVHAASTPWPGSDADGCTAGVPTSPTTNFPWTLAAGSDGDRTVYARFRHGSDAVFAQDSITFATPPSDTAAPVVTVTPPSPDGANGWFVSKPVTVDVTATDASGIAAVSCSPPFTEASSTSTSKSGTVSVSAEGTSTVSCTATDGATPPNTSSAVTADVKIDTVDPTIGHTVNPASPDGANSWYVTAPTVTFSCSDASPGSGLSTCLADGTASNAITLEESAVAQTVGGTGTDVAGRTAADSVGGLMVDLSDPTVTCGTPPTFILNEPGAQVSATVTDPISGPAATPISTSVSTGSVGTFSASLTGSDNAGRSTIQSCSYHVTYNFSGFFQPIDDTMINAAKAGQAIPVKWRLTDFAGIGVGDPASFKNVSSVAGSGSCSGLPADAIEDYTGSSGLQYLGDGYWQFNWKTPKSYVGQCRTMKLSLNDGTAAGTIYRTADFLFK